MDDLEFEVGPSHQLEHDLRASISRALATRRPILTHLNADTSWLLSLAVPPEDIIRTQRHRFNILIDPWLKGPQSDVASWFSTQWHSIQSSVQTIEELNQYLEEVEQLAAEADAQALPEQNNKKKGARASKSTPLPNGSPNGVSIHGATNNPPAATISAVVISHEFTDHCHRATLLELPPSTPIYATTAAVPLIKSWSHFHAVHDIPVFSASDPWPELPADLNATQPSWLRFARLTTESNALYYHSAVAVLFAQAPSPPPSTPPRPQKTSRSPKAKKDTKAAAKPQAEAVIYTPHGISSSSLLPLTTPLPSTTIHIDPLALLHGLHSIRLQGLQQLNLGLPNALAAQKLLNVPYWVGTHDEEKKGAGVVSWLLRRERWKLGGKGDDEGGEGGEGKDEEEEGMDGEGRYVELGSGEGILLE